MRQSAVGIFRPSDSPGVLLEFRPNIPGLPNTGMAGFFGGGVGAGESPDVALLREITEEVRCIDGGQVPVQSMRPLWRGVVTEANTAHT